MSDLGLLSKTGLNDYKPHVKLDYKTLTDKELQDGAGGTMLFDVESFENFFLIAFKDYKTKNIILFKPPFDKDKLIWLMQNYTCVGFNNLYYDLPMIGMALTDQDPAKIKKVSNDLIKGAHILRLQATYGFSMPQGRTIDLIEVCPSYGSLKLYGARLHAKRIQDLPWSAEQSLEKWQIPITQDYCINDLDLTELIFENLTERLELRRLLSEEYKQDLMSKSDAQIAEMVIGSEIKKLSGKLPPQATTKTGAKFKFMAPSNLFFQGEYMKGILRRVCQAEFKVGPDGYLICPKEITNLQIVMGDSTYRMGIGGMHSSEKNMAIVATKEFEISDRDVASYYPKIALNCNLGPKGVKQYFLPVYRGLMERRLEAKRAKNITVSESLKVTINGTFGKTASPHSFLYAPEVMLQITVGGQLYLLMLIEHLETFGISVVSANTDGIVMCYMKHQKELANTVVEEWEKITGFETEETQYKALYARDVNAYLAIKTNGEIKGKNIFYDPWRAKDARDKMWQFQKNPNCQICIEAVEKLVVAKTPIEKTIQDCKDIKKFLSVKNVTGGAHKNGDYLGKTIRWYIAKGEGGIINYIQGNKQVPDTFGAKPIMELPQKFPLDVNLKWYIKRAEEMLENMGFNQESKS